MVYSWHMALYQSFSFSILIKLFSNSAIFPLKMPSFSCRIFTSCLYSLFSCVNNKKSYVLSSFLYLSVMGLSCIVKFIIFRYAIQHIMQYLKPELQGEEASIILTLLDASREISQFLRHSPVVVMESTNLFGDQQLHQDIKCDEIVEKHLKENPLVKAFASEERPHYQQIAEGEGYVVTYDPLDGSSIIDTNFAIGSIFSIWKTDPNNLVGKTLGDQVNAVITVYGPRTTALIYNPARKIVQELTLIQKDWIVSHQHLVIKSKSKMFSPGNLRAVNENQAYDKVVTAWIRKGYTLRYTGGLVPDVGQIFIKGHGVLSNIGSESHKCKLRALYEAAAVGFLVEKAGGSSVTTGRKSLMEFKITSFDDRLSFAVGSSEEIQSLSHLF